MGQRTSTGAQDLTYRENWDKPPAPTPNAPTLHYQPPPPRQPAITPPMQQPDDYDVGRAFGTLASFTSLARILAVLCLIVGGVAITAGALNWDHPAALPAVEGGISLDVCGVLLLLLSGALQMLGGIGMLLRSINREIQAMRYESRR